MWSSAAVAHLLQGSTCCAFRDGILHTLVVTSDYLSYCCLSIISNQSAHSPLTSDINKTFSEICIMDVQPTNLQQLRDAIMSIWSKISEECFQHLVESMSRRIKAVLKSKGGPTRY